MTQTQIIHIGMINSFNLITERNTFEEIVESNLTFFAHSPEQDVSLKSLHQMVRYFESIEMYDHCSELLDYINLNFDDKGKDIGSCECDYPVIKKYSKKSSCGFCFKRLRA